MRLIKNDLHLIFNRYGRSMSIIDEESGEKIEFKGFLQPLRYKNKMYLNKVTTELSYTNTRKFLLLSPADISVETADGYESIIKVGDDEFCIDHSEKVYAKDTPVYSWSIVHQVNL